MKNLGLLKIGEQQKAVHDLRVATKQLRSYLKLIYLLRKENGKQGFEKTEQLFSILGKQRDIEMGLSLIAAIEKEKGAGYVSLKEHLQSAQTRTAQSVKTAIKEYDTQELRVVAQKITTELKNEQPETFLARIRTLITKEFRTILRYSGRLSKQAHRVRKGLKNVFYWAELEPPGYFLTEDQHKKIRKAMRYLGDWQDHQVLLSKVRHFRKDFIPPKTEDFARLKDLETVIRHKMESLLLRSGKQLEGVGD